jgi:hypothetical protein
MIINVRKSDNRVIDVGQNYNAQIATSEIFPDGTIPAGDNPGHYEKRGQAIVKRAQAEIEKDDPAEKQTALRALIDAALTIDHVKAILRRMV